jgi:hypothetical protein
MQCPLENLMEVKMKDEVKMKKENTDVNETGNKDAVLRFWTGNWRT